VDGGKDGLPGERRRDADRHRLVVAHLANHWLSAERFVLIVSNFEQQDSAVEVQSRLVTFLEEVARRVTAQEAEIRPSRRVLANVMTSI
jgi:hypothetical protein